MLTSDGDMYAFQASHRRPKLDHSELKPARIGVRRMRQAKIADKREDTVSHVEAFIDLIQIIWSLKSFRYRSEVARRLHRLRSDCIDEEISLSTVSLRNFVEHIRLRPLMNMPQIAVTDDGNIRASWTKSSSEHFAVEFLERNLARFVLFSVGYDGSQSRIAGMVPASSVISLQKKLQIYWA